MIVYDGEAQEELYTALSKLIGDENFQRVVRWFVDSLYAKRVVAGKVDLELSAEEKQALSQALHEKPISYE